MTIEELSKGIEEGKWTCRELTLKCLAAIAAEDGDGRKLNSVAQISADALAEADAIDEEIRKSGRRSPLHGVPVLLKDNIDVRNMHTTASSYALHDLIADEDAAVPKATLRRFPAVPACAFRPGCPIRKTGSPAAII